MAQFVQRYLQYRHVGFGRLAALRFAWMLVSRRGRPVSIR
jgi:hypothetical protein